MLLENGPCNLEWARLHLANDRALFWKPHRKLHYETSMCWVSVNNTVYLDRCCPRQGPAVDACQCRFGPVPRPLKSLVLSVTVPHRGSNRHGAGFQLLLNLEVPCRLCDLRPCMARYRWMAEEASAMAAKSALYAVAALLRKYRGSHKTWAVPD